MLLLSRVNADRRFCTKYLFYLLLRCTVYLQSITFLSSILLNLMCPQIGDSAVGKSSVLLRFVDNTFSDSFISNIGSDYKEKTLEVGGFSAKLQIVCYTFNPSFFLHSPFQFSNSLSTTTTTT